MQIVIIQNIVVFNLLHDVIHTQYINMTLDTIFPVIAVLILPLTLHTLNLLHEMILKLDKQSTVCIYYMTHCT